MRAPLCLLLLLAGCAAAPRQVTADDFRLADDSPAEAEADAAALNDLMFGDAPLADEAAPEPREPAYAGPAYFPPSLGESIVQCASGAAAQPVLSAFERNWYSRQLAAAGEPSLYLESQARRPDGASTLRFTWLRSFHAPVMIRVETAGPGLPRLVARQLSGAGGYDPGAVEKSLERPLTSAEAARLHGMLSESRLFDLVPDLCEIGLDGAQWIFEAADAGGYHFVSFWSPRRGPADALGRYLMALTGWELGEVY